MTIEEVAELTRTHRDAVTALIDHGELIAIDLAGPGAQRRRLRFRRSDIDAFLASREVKRSGFSDALAIP